MPIVVILPSLPASSAADIGRALADAGVRIMEVPLRGGDEQAMIESIKALADAVAVRVAARTGSLSAGRLSPAARPSIQMACRDWRNFNEAAPRSGATVCIDAAANRGA